MTRVKFSIHRDMEFGQNLVLVCASGFQSLIGSHGADFC